MLGWPSKSRGCGCCRKALHSLGDETHEGKHCPAKVTRPLRPDPSQPVYVNVRSSMHFDLPLLGGMHRSTAYLGLAAPRRVSVLWMWDCMRLRLVRVRSRCVRVPLCQCRGKYHVGTLLCAGVMAEVAYPREPGKPEGFARSTGITPAPMPVSLVLYGHGGPAKGADTRPNSTMDGHW